MIHYLFAYIIPYVSTTYHLIVFILIFIVALIIVCCSLIGVGGETLNISQTQLELRPCIVAPVLNNACAGRIILHILKHLLSGCFNISNKGEPYE